MATPLGYAIAASTGNKDLVGHRDPELDQYLGMSFRMHDRHLAGATYFNSIETRSKPIPIPEPFPDELIPQ